jgi:DNA-binding NarL/FixJ family response regulator
MHIDSIDTERSLDNLRQAAAEARPYRLVIICQDILDDRVEHLVRSIRNDTSLADTRVLFIAVSGMRGDGARARSMGMQGYLCEFVDSSELSECISVVMGMDVSEYCLITRHYLAEIRKRGFSLSVLDDDQD